jgi:hypothetical protein
MPFLQISRAFQRFAKAGRHVRKQEKIFPSGARMSQIYDAGLIGAGATPSIRIFAQSCVTCRSAISRLESSERAAVHQVRSIMRISRRFLTAALALVRVIARAQASAVPPSSSTG